MKYNTFLERKKNLSLTIDNFADIIGYSPSSIKKWKEKDETPKWVDIVISYLEINKEIQKNIKKQTDNKNTI